MPVKINFFQFTAPFYDWLHFASAKRTLRCLEKLNFLEVGDSVIDLGGGTGRVSLLIAQKVKKLVIVDASAAMLKVAASRGLEIVCGTAEKIPVAKDSVDKITIIDAFHHFQEPEIALKEIFRVLKPGGKVFIEEVFPHGLFGNALVFAENVLRMNSFFYQPKTITAMALEIFSEAQFIPINKRFYAIVLRKPIK